MTPLEHCHRHSKRTLSTHNTQNGESLDIKHRCLSTRHIQSKDRNAGKTEKTIHTLVKHTDQEKVGHVGMHIHSAKCTRGMNKDALFIVTSAPVKVEKSRLTTYILNTSKVGPPWHVKKSPDKRSYAFDVVPKV